MDPKQSDRKRNILNVTLAIFAGQVGCVTLVIILAATFAGLWLDNRFNSGRSFTIGLLLVSIPISLVVMLFLARSVIAKIKTKTRNVDQDQQKE
jgi:magnesium-transporting ATPase (P-type)